MTAAILKQAREALEECKNALSHGFDERTGQPVFKSVAAMLAHISASNAAAALTAFDSLSDYDKAVHALATYLPDGEHSHFSLTEELGLSIPAAPDGDGTFWVRDGSVVRGEE